MRIAALLLAAAPAIAGPAPVILSHQGRLADADGHPVTGQVRMRFSLFKNAQPPVLEDDASWWESGEVTVQLSADGTYAVLLGNPQSGTGTLPSTAFQGEGERWLGVEVAGEHLLPRMLVTSVPWALSANRAAVADAMGEHLAADYALTVDAAAYAEAAGAAALTSAKEYADDAAEGGLASARTYADGVGAATLGSAKTYADVGDAATLTLSTARTDAGDITTLATAKSYADGLVSSTLTSARTYTDATTGSTLTSARSYTDAATASALTSARTYSDSGDATSLGAAKTYADTQDASDRSFATTADAAILAAAKAYTDTQIAALSTAGYLTQTAGDARYQRTQVDRSPGDLVFNEIVTRVVGASTGSYNGKITYTRASDGKRFYGRAATTAICQADFGAGARMCSLEDLMMMMAANAVRPSSGDGTPVDLPSGAFSLPTPATWINATGTRSQINSGTPNGYNDCFNWSGVSAPNGSYSANYYVAPSSGWPYGYTEPDNCSQSHQLMCCK
jgi:hypothetical protein